MARKHAIPNRPFLSLDDKTVPWGDFGNERDRHLPSSEIPTDIFRTVPSDKHKDLWEEVRGAYWLYLVDKHVETQRPKTAAITDNIRALEQDLNGMADRLRNLDPDTMDVLNEVGVYQLSPKMNDESLLNISSILERLSAKCEMARQETKKARKRNEAEKLLAHNIALAWKAHCGKPATTPDGEYAKLLNYVASHEVPGRERITKFHVSENMVRTGAKSVW